MNNTSTYRKVLAIDTASRVQSLALLDGDTVLEQSQRRVKFDHGSTLLEHVARACKEQNVDLSDLDLITVGLGPGSFTGLRVGVAAAKSLARAHDIPIVGVSTLAALAYPVARTHQFAGVCPAYDARRGEVYAGIYRWDEPRLVEVEADHTARPETLRERLIELAQTSRPVILVGDAPRKYDELALWERADVNWETPDVTVLPAWADAPSAVAIAVLGRQRAIAGALDDLRSLEPNYIRPTDAEIAADKRDAANSRVS